MQTILVDASVWGMFFGVGLIGIGSSAVGTVWTWRFLERRQLRPWLRVIAMFPTWFIFTVGGWIFVDIWLALRLVAHITRGQRQGI